MNPKSIVLAIMIGMIGGVNLAPGETRAQSVRLSLPPNRVIAVHFHRTQRCPTCLRVSQTVANFPKKDFAQYRQSGQLRWAEMDFESPRNANSPNRNRLQDCS